MRLFLCALVFVVSASVIAQENFKDQLAQYDRDDIHSIHKRLYSKEGRHEVFLMTGGIFNNNGYALIQGGYQYHFFESLGFEAVGGGYGFQLEDDDSLAFYQASITFSPIYGKISWFTWAVLNFDLYTLGGAGVVNYKGQADGSSFMGNIGLGTRVFINEWLSARIEFRDYIYNRTLINDSEISHNYALSAGLSIFFPFSQDL